MVQMNLFSGHGPRDADGNRLVDLEWYELGDWD